MAYLTADEMRAADEETVGKHGVSVLALMESAGAATAGLTRSMLGGAVVGRKIAVLAGKGNNGGDGMVAARHLHNWGANVMVSLSERSSIGEVPALQLSSVERAGISVTGPDGSVGGFDILIDALLGYGSRGAPREPVRTMILSANAARTPIVAVDIPSGLDATTGVASDPCVTATATLTFGFPKAGFLNPKSREFVGKLYLSDIGFPLEVYQAVQQTTPFARDTIVQIW